MMANSERIEQKHATIRSIIDAVSGHRHVEAHGLVGSAAAHLAAEFARDSGRTVVMLVADQKEGLCLYNDLSFFRRNENDVVLVPHWEVGPYEPLSPHPDVESERLAALAALHAGQGRAVVLPVRSLMQRVMPRSVLNDLCLPLETGREYRHEELRRKLFNLGYLPVPLVEDRGSFSLRGDILDIFPAAAPQPVRLDFFGDQLESIRPFSPADQRTGADSLEQLQLIPAREMILAGEYLELLLEQLRDRCDDLDMPRSRREALLDEFREGLPAPGREFLLPFNYQQLATLFDYLPDALWLLVDPPEIERQIDLFADEIRSGETRAAAGDEPYAEADSLFLQPDEVGRHLETSDRLDLTNLQIYHLDADWPLLRIEAAGNGDLVCPPDAGTAGLERLAGQLRHWQQEQWRQLLVCHQPGQAERLRDMLAAHGLELPISPDGHPEQLQPGELLLTVGELTRGFRLTDERLAVISEEDIFGRRTRRRSRRQKQLAMMPGLGELKDGDFIVHTDHGIGRYRGLQHLQTGPAEGDFLYIEYAGDDRLYLPIDRIERVQKYVGAEGGVPRLDKMGGSAWEKARLKARAAIEELARDLLKVQARRSMNKGISFSPPDELFREFEAAFPHEETDDQQAAIDDVIEDMLSEQPMDRLVCGDVGYGKTEVAIRAAFKAVLDGRQVAVLTPTTILARQHWETFRERFRGLAVEVEMLSRLRSSREQKQIMGRLGEGRIDIVIGTHRLLQRDIRFKNLGLIIVDEEQRFGVAHKEKLKRFRAEVDILTLTATPIPRTLHQSMVGLRDLSVIDTPPVDRLAIRTYVTRFNDDLIREAILRELRRGGQVFFVHNRVQSIDAMADFLGRLVPEAKVAVGHGQMGERELEQVMLDFIEGRSNVLVCSTIIENGIDIPRANTMIVNRADCFGLSQLYQLRGRVGRSDRRAYAYLLIPGEGALGRDARERLRVLQEQTELGAGFRIASQDLELRGAGELLGSRQAGQVAAVGFEMYTEMLEETIRELQGLEREDRIDPDVRLGMSAYLPEDYIADPNQRLVLYRRMASAEQDDELYALADELRDRFGAIPEPGRLLLEVMKLRQLLKRLRIESAEFDGRRLIFGFHASTPVAPERIIARIQAGTGIPCSLSADYRLTYETGRQEADALLQTAKKELQAFL